MITVRKAIWKGHIFVNLPIISFILLTGIVLSRISEKKIIAESHKNIGIVISIILSLIYRSIAITKWRIWAYKNSLEIDELKYIAINQGLAWSSNGFLEFRTKKCRATLKRLEETYNAKKQYCRDNELPSFNELHFSKRKKILSLLLTVPFLFFGVWMYAQSSELFTKIFSVIIVLLFGILSFTNVKDLFDNKSQLTISETGIETIKLGKIYGAEISNERITTEYTSKGAELNYLEFDYLNGRAKILIDDLDRNKIYIEKLIRIYTKRFEQTKN